MRALFVGATIAFALAMVPAHLIWPTGPDDVPIWMDGIQDAVAQRYFFRDAWAWPLLDTRSIMPGRGVSIAMADALPILSLPFKLVRHALSPWFTTIGLWLVLCFALQPIAAALALRAAGERRGPALVCGGVMAACMPFFLGRIIHVSLMGQFTILLAYALHFRLLAQSRRAAVAAPVLLVLTWLANPYLTAMAGAVIASASVSLLARRARAWPPMAAVAAGGAACFLVALGLGYFRTGASEAGYGVYSLNLLAPFWPMHATLFSFVPALPYARPEQSLEGYAWLGAGLWLLIGWGLAARHRMAWRAHAGLVALGVGLTAFAASQYGYAGRIRLWAVPIDPALPGIFRASGRFFWPVGYGLMLWAILATRRLKARTAMIVLMAASLLQVADTQGLRRDARALLRATPPDDATVTALRTAMTGVRHVLIRPTYECGLDLWGPAGMDVMTVFRVASETGATLDTFYTARRSAHPDCASDRPAILPPDTIAIDVPPFPATPTSALRCGRIGALRVCRAASRG